MSDSLKKLTQKQDQILEYIKDKIRESGFPPTVREIGDKFNITVKGAYDHIKAIEKKGYIRTEQNKSRAIVILEQTSELTGESLSIPLVGRIAAGVPITAEENIDEYLAFPKSMFSNGTYFALQVKGDSMINGGIHNGDIAIIKQQQAADNGEIIAALLEDEATLKRLKISGSKIQLMPENEAYKPIAVENLTVLGVLAALFRRY